GTKGLVNKCPLMGINQKIKMVGNIKDLARFFEPSCLLPEHGGCSELSPGYTCYVNNQEYDAESEERMAQEIEKEEMEKERMCVVDSNNDEDEDDELKKIMARYIILRNQSIADRAVSLGRE